MNDVVEASFYKAPGGGGDWITPRYLVELRGVASALNYLDRCDLAVADSDASTGRAEEAVPEDAEVVAPGRALVPGAEAVQVRNCARYL